MSDKDSKEELLPCPFCGPEHSDLIVIYGRVFREWLYWVECQYCESRAAAYLTRELAIKNWNTRPPQKVDKREFFMDVFRWGFNSKRIASQLRNIFDKHLYGNRIRFYDCEVPSPPTDQTEKEK